MTGRQTALLVSTDGGQAVQLGVDDPPEKIIGAILTAAAQDRFVSLHQPLGSEGQVFVRVGAIIAFWDQQVEIVNDPRAFGVQQTPGGIHLPPKPN